MDISINTPALLFPAISLIMLAYTNRFLALSSVVRNLHDRYKATQQPDINLQGQIRNLRHRLKLIRSMQFFGVLSFLIALGTMYFIYIGQLSLAHFAFAGSVLSFSVSLCISLIEIRKSTKALELELSDMEGIESRSMLKKIKEYLNK
jgi:hypothetical protein